MMFSLLNNESSLWIVLQISLGWLLANVSTINYLPTSCPIDCACDHLEDYTSLTINCQRKRGNVINDSLRVEINELLLKMKNLTKLKIAETGLTSLPMETCNLKLLRTLHVDYNQLTTLPDNCFGRLRHLEEFTADYNNISHLQDGLFDGLLHLQKISVNFNKIKTIGLNLFTNSSDLTSLNIIQLNNNLLAELEPWPFIRAISVPRISVEVFENQIVRFTNKIQWNSNCQPYQTPYNKVMMILDLTDNLVESISDLVRELGFNSSVNVLCWLLKTELRLAGNNLACDCLDFLYFATAKRISHTPLIDNVYCKQSIGFQSRRAIEVPLEELVCKISEQCPNKCQCVSQPFNSTFHVNCTNTELTLLPLILPNSDFRHHILMPKVMQKYQLDFSHNNISTLESRDFFLNTFSLDLSNSHLRSITHSAWTHLKQVRRIYLHTNILTTIPATGNISNFTFDVLSIYNNPFSCGCDQVWLKTWLKSVYDRLENPLSIQCYSPLRLRGRTIFSVDDMEFCNEPKPDQLENNTAIVSILCILIPLAIFSVTIFILKAFRVKVFSTLGVHPFDRDECEGEEMEYDVFISYAHEDNNKAKEILVFLEMNSYKVCFHERDFLAGSLILDNIIEAICKSKRVLCLASENFLASDYCMEEFHMAQFHSIKLKRTRVIMMMASQFQQTISTTAEQIHADEQRRALLLQESPNSFIPINGFSVSLNNYIKSHTYIDLESNMWRNQLLYAMPIQRLGPPGGSNEIQETIQSTSCNLDESTILSDSTELHDNDELISHRNDDLISLM